MGDTYEPANDGLWEERFAVVVLYYATGGAGWTDNTGWLSSTNHCTWQGLVCNALGGGHPGSVSELVLCKNLAIMFFFN